MENHRKLIVTPENSRKRMGKKVFLDPTKNDQYLFFYFLENIIPRKYRI